MKYSNHSRNEGDKPFHHVPSDLQDKTELLMRAMYQKLEPFPDRLRQELKEEIVKVFEDKYKIVLPTPTNATKSERYLR